MIAETVTWTTVELLWVIGIGVVVGGFVCLITGLHKRGGKRI